MAINVSTAARAIYMCFEADIPLAMHGDSGIGKSAIVRQAFRKWTQNTLDRKTYVYEKDQAVRHAVDSGDFNTEIHDVRLATKDAADFGLPIRLAEVSVGGRIAVIPADSVNESHSVLDYIHSSTRPDWWPRSNFSGLSCVFLDELNRGNRHAQNAAMSICAERMLGKRYAPPGFRLVSANNPDSGDFVTESIEGAMRARWCHVHVTTSIDSFIQARSAYLDDTTLSCMAEVAGSRGRDTIQLLKESPLEGWSIDSQVKFCPRTWEYLAKFAKYLEWERERMDIFADPETRNALTAIVEGLIGVSNATPWLSSFKEKTYLTVESLLVGDTTYESLDAAGPMSIASMVIMIRNRVNDDNLRDREGNFCMKRLERLATFVEMVGIHKREMAVSLFYYLDTTASTDPACRQLTYNFRKLPSYKRLKAALEERSLGV